MAPSHINKATDPALFYQLAEAGDDLRNTIAALRKSAPPSYREGVDWVDGYLLDFQSAAFEPKISKKSQKHAGFTVGNPRKSRTCCVQRGHKSGHSRNSNPGGA